jgi:hypothetical protein
MTTKELCDALRHTHPSRTMCKEAADVIERLAGELYSVKPLPDLTDRIAEAVWRSEYKRATGKDRNVSWPDGLNEYDLERYRFVAREVLSRLAPTCPDQTGGNGNTYYTNVAGTKTRPSY